MSGSLSEAALHATVWVAMGLFVASEVRYARAVPGRATTWGWHAAAIGALLLMIHMAIALQTRHGWSHASVVHRVDEQTRAVYGMSWPGAAWVNYLFVAVWVIEIAWRTRAPASHLSRSRGVLVAIRTFYFIVLVNATIVFAAPARRIYGVVLMALLLWSWRGMLRPSARAATAVARLAVKGDSHL